MGQKMACLGHRVEGQRDLAKTSRKRYIGGVGSKRTSSGGNGGHHVWWGGLIFRLLLCVLSLLCLVGLPRWPFDVSYTRSATPALAKGETTPEAFMQEQRG
jgi:hypothetical protein